MKNSLQLWFLSDKLTVRLICVFFVVSELESTSFFLDKSGHVFKDERYM